MADWLLAIPYLLAVPVMLGIGWLMGASANVSVATFKFPDPDPLPDHLQSTWPCPADLFHFCISIALGLAIISWLGAVLGVTGFFIPRIVFTVFLFLIWSALFRLWLARRTLRAQSHAVPEGMSRGMEIQKRRLWWLLVVLMLPVTVLSINALIGALVPDMNQDPLWYHLSVPQQWVFDGKFAVYPSVMPSAYPLAVESIFASIFLFRVNPILCSLLVAGSGIVLFLSMISSSALVVSTRRARVIAAMACVAVWVPAVAGYGMIAPVQPKNDVVVMLWAFAGAMMLWLPLLRSAAPIARSWAIVGFLLGTACSAKPIVLGMAAPVIVGAAMWLLWYGLRRNHSVHLLILPPTACLSALIMAMAPWAWRGFNSHGLPLFPLGQGMFIFNPDFEPLIAAFNHVHTLPGVKQNGWYGQIIAVPSRLLAAIQSGEKAVLLMLLSGLLGIVATKGVWRVYSLVVLVQVLLVATGNGLPVIYRLIAPSYCIAAPLTGYLAVRLADQLPLKKAVVLIASVAVAMWASLANQQIRIGQWSTFNWKYRPVLSAQSIYRYAAHAELGSTYTEFELVRKSLDPEARIFLLGNHYPFYLHRSAIWNDEVVKAGGILERWTTFQANEAREFLFKNRITAVLHASSEVSTETAENLVALGSLMRTDLPDDLENAGWTLYVRPDRVN